MKHCLLIQCKRDDEVMKKIVLISAFYLEIDTSRPFQIYKALANYDYSVRVLTTDFNHSSKSHHFINDKNVKQFSVPGYYGTFSLKRICSHIVYAVKVYFELMKVDYDLVYLVIPTNFSAFLATIVSKKKGAKIISDVIDIWPQETRSKLMTLPFKVWQYFRDYSVRNSDKVLLGTTAFCSNVKNICVDYEVLYLSKTQSLAYSKHVFLDCIQESISLLYLGNFSYSYDFKSLIYILLNSKKKTKLKIIGDGPFKREFIKILDSKKIVYEDFGLVFNENEKEGILKSAHFGYNAVNEGIQVGLSYKSIDYLSFGLPIINSISFDTKNLIEEYQAGLNFDPARLDDLLIRLDTINQSEYEQMRKGAIALFEDQFSFSSFEKKINNVVKKLV